MKLTGPQVEVEATIHLFKTVEMNIVKQITGQDCDMYYTRRHSSSFI